jgi:hypothetical protein
MGKESLAEISTFKSGSKTGIIVAAVAGLAAGALIGALTTAATMGQSAKGKKVRGEPAVPASASNAPAGSGSAAPTDGGAPSAGQSVAERAANGDSEAIKQLEAKPMEERSAEEAIALSRSRAAVKRKEIAELARKINLVPQVVKDDKEVAARLKELTEDREVATDLMKMYASLPEKIGPDLLYNVVATGKKNETTRLAEELLYSKDVRSKAPLQLAPLLDLRKAEKCEDVLKALEGVKRDADRRAFMPLMKFHNKRGCGEKKLDDCWPCLREGDLLKDATTAAQKRAAPL